MQLTLVFIAALLSVAAAVPGQPTSLRFSRVLAESLRVEWEPPSSGDVVGYKVVKRAIVPIPDKPYSTCSNDQRDVNQGNTVCTPTTGNSGIGQKRAAAEWTDCGSCTARQLHFDVTGLAVGTEYEFEVRAYDSYSLGKAAVGTVRTGWTKPRAVDEPIVKRGAKCTPTCKNGGVCTDYNTCHCPTGYTGATCQTPVCSPSCKNGGVCTAPNTCLCPRGWSEAGSNAELFDNLEHKLNLNQNVPWSGPTCETPTCAFGCKNGGVCSKPNVCTCLTGYGGFDCAIKIFN